SATGGPLEALHRRCPLNRARCSTPLGVVRSASFNGVRFSPLHGWFRASAPRWALLTSLLVAAACSSNDQPTGPSTRPQFAISDAVHSGGNPHFFFLPPLVPFLSYTATT